jgi:hypothetical protein
MLYINNIIYKLYDFVLMREIWSYLIVRDISWFITVSKDIQTTDKAMIISTNKLVSQNIILDLYNSISEERI